MHTTEAQVTAVAGQDQIVSIDDRRALESYFSRDPALHIYELGDLDPFFWPRTRWWALRPASGETRAVALLYDIPGTPIVIALDREGLAGKLLEGLEPLLPARFRVHASPGAAERLSSQRRLEHEGTHLKMALRQLWAPPSMDAFRPETLTADHADEVRAFLDDVYPDNWFDPRMLETGMYVAIRSEGRLASMAGVHVYSTAQRVAALGCIATRADLRGKGLGACATAALCEKLQRTVDVIGLNVRADNRPAIACYSKLGFVNVAAFDSWIVERESPGC